jgi:hypothetical protein
MQFSRLADILSLAGSEERWHASYGVVNVLHAVERIAI